MIAAVTATLQLFATDDKTLTITEEDCEGLDDFIGEVITDTVGGDDSINHLYQLKMQLIACCKIWRVL